MDGQRTDGPPTLIERAGLAAGAGACGAALAAAGCYTFYYGMVSFISSLGWSVMAGSAASGTIAELFLLGLAVAMSVGGGAILSRALGVSTWRRSTLISAVAHAIGIPLWIWTDIYLISHSPSATYFNGLVAYPAAAYAFAVPLIVVFSTFRRDGAKGLAITLPLWIGTCALAVTGFLLESERLALTSGVVAWVVLPAVSVLGLAMIGALNR